MTEADILVAAARGNLSRYRLGGKWYFTMNRKPLVKRKAVFDLMRRGLLAPTVMLPGVSEDIEITVRGREALQENERP